MGFFSAASNAIGTQITNDTNEKIAYENRNLSTEQFNQQMAFSREQYEYQKQMDDYNKALQQKVFEREDTALSRLKNDARNAGISPLAALSASGSPASSASISSGASTAQPGIPSYGQPNIQAPDFSSLANIIPNMVSIAKGVQEVKGMRLNNELSAKLQLPQIVSAYNQVFRENSELRSLLSDENFKRYYGITDSMTDKERIARVVMRDVFGISNSYPGNWNESDDYNGEELRKKFSDVQQFGAFTNKADGKAASDAVIKYLMSILSQIDVDPSLLNPKY